MNRLFKFLLGVAAVFVFIFLALAVYIQMQGKEIVRSRLESILEKPVAIGDIRLSLPFNLQLNDVQVAEVLSVQRIIVGVGFINPFQNEINLSQLTLWEPRIVIPQDKIVRGDAPESSPVGVPEQMPSPLSPSTGALNSKFHVAADQLVIRNGHIQITSATPDRKPVIIDGVEMTARHVAFPLKPMKTEFVFAAAIPGQQEQLARLHADGWFNLAQKDMDGKISVDGLDSGVLVAFFGGQESVLQNTVVDATADLKAKNNDMDVRCHLKVKAFNFKTAQEDLPLESMILEGLRSIGQGMELTFNFKTKMDDFKLQAVSFSGNVWQDERGNSPEQAQAPSAPVLQ